MDFLEDVINKGKWIVLILISAFFLFGCLKAIVTAPGTWREVKKAVWVEDGLVHPENDGKLVAVVFHPSEWGNATDTQMNAAFDSPVIRRTVQQLDWTGTRYLWETVDSPRGLKNKVYVGAVSGDTGETGEIGNTGDNGDTGDSTNTFTLDPDLLGSISTLTECQKEDYTEEALENLSAFGDGMYYGGYYWFSEAPYGCMADLEEDASENDLDYYGEYEGAVRIRYLTIDLSSVESLVIIGYQNGNTLDMADDLDIRSVHENVSSLKELLKKEGNYLILGLIMVGSVSIGLIYLSVKKLRD